MVGYALALLGACGGDSPPSPALDGARWAGTITTEGNVTTVINESGSVWGGTAVLVEEASIGVEFGRDPYMFGRVSSVAASDDRIYVVDRQVRALRVYDWHGRYVRDIGRQGQGPGEFQSAMAVGIDGDGRVWLEDIVAARILVFEPDGSSVATLTKQPPLVASLSSLMVVTADGRAFVAGRVRETETTLARSGMIPYGLDGSVGELIDVTYPGPSPPALEAEADGRSSGLIAPFHPRGIVTFTPVPAVLRGFPDAYRFRLDYLDGRSLVVEQTHPLVAVEDAEAAAVTNAVTSYLRETDPSWIWPDVPMPSVKPAYSNLIAAVSGETWVIRAGPSSPIPDCNEDSFEPTGKPRCWRERRIIDAFGADGRYLGDVIVPDDLDLEQFGTRPFIRDTDVIGVTEDDSGTIRVKRYRLVLPGEGNS